MELAKGQQQNPKTVHVYSELCSGCHYCQLACSFVKTGRFALSESRIKILRVNGKERYSVGFSTDCDRCGFCARYCYMGVLKEVKG